MRVAVSREFILSLVLIFLSNSLPYAVIFLTAAAVHESGHLAFLKLYKIKKPVLSLGLLGGCITADMASLSYRGEMAVYLGGAIFNFVSCVVSLAVMRYVNGEHLIFFFFANLFYAVLNLLPIATLDGGHVLECCMLCFCDNPFFALNVCNYISFIFSAAAIGLFLTIIRYFKNNLTLVLLLAWIVFTACFQSPPGAGLHKPRLRRHSTG